MSNERMSDEQMSKFPALQMSDRELIFKITHDKRATMSHFLRSLMVKEQMSKSLIFFSKLLNRSFIHKNKQFTKNNFE